MICIYSIVDKWQMVQGEWHHFFKLKDPSIEMLFEKKKLIELNVIFFSKREHSTLHVITQGLDVIKWGGSTCKVSYIM